MKRLALLTALVALSMGCKVRADPADLARCEDPPPEVVASVSAGLTKGAEYSLRRVHLVHSEDNGWSWFSAEHAHRDDLPKDLVDIVTFATKDLADPHAWVSAERHARSVSSWPDGAQAGINVRDDGLVESRGCVAADRPPTILG